MRLHVSSYSIAATNYDVPIRELGFKAPVGIVDGYTDYHVSCDFVPIADEGESTHEMLSKLQEWINGREINVVSAVPNKPRCFYCGTMNDRNSVKCPQCGGEMR